MCEAMAKSPIKRTTQREQLEEEIAAEFLLKWKRRCANEFSLEFARVGLKFLRDRIDPDDQKEFIAAFDELLSLGCIPKTLASTLYCFCRAYLRPDLRPIPPPYPDAATFPSKAARREYEKTLREAARIVQEIDSDIVAILARQARRIFPEFRTGDLSQLLHCYADVLSAWYAPRKDIIQSYAWILPCLYSKVATQKFQFPLVAQLLEAFGYMSAPNRQHRRRDSSRGGYEPLDQSLERNVRNFIDQHALACERLETDLSQDDVKEEMRHRAECDRWAERDLPMGLRDELNPFNWSSVFLVKDRRGLEAQKGCTRTAKLEGHPHRKLAPGQERRPRRSLEM